MVTVTHRFHCGYFCRHCGAFNIGKGYLLRKYIDDENRGELDTDADAPESAQLREHMEKARKNYQEIRHMTNVERNIGHFNIKDTGVSHVQGTCSRCGKIQPWAELWELKKSAGATMLTWAAFAVVILGVLMSLVCISLLEETLGGIGIFAVTTLATVLLMRCANKIRRAVEDPQLEARNQAILEAMRLSPYDHQSYPYMAREDDELDLNDRRAREMAAALWPEKLPQ